MQTDHCRHWKGIRPLLSGGDGKCEAGVDMYSVSVASRDKTTVATLPCIEGRCPQATCGKREFPTAEEVKRHDAEMEKWAKESFEKVAKARAAIVAKIGKWKRGSHGASGIIDCPVCGKKDALRYSRAGYNGHIHANCATQDCVSWME